MTRETKAERQLREAGERIAFEEKFIADYPSRLLNLVYNYGKLDPNVFNVQRDEEQGGFIFGYHSTWSQGFFLPEKISQYSINLLDELTSAEACIQDYLLEEAEERRLDMVKMQAKNKALEVFTEEERKLLGIK